MADTIRLPAEVQSRDATALRRAPEGRLLGVLRSDERERTDGPHLLPLPLVSAIANRTVRA